MKRARVLLADDHAIVLEGLRRVLEPDFDVVGAVADGRALVAAAGTLRPDIVIADVSMPLLNGIEAARQIRQSDPKVKIVFLSMHADVTYASEAIRAGGSAYVLKSSAGAEIREAIREARRGRIYVTPSIDRAVVMTQAERGRGPKHLEVELTRRQREVLRLLGEGRSLKEVAALLNISIKTAEFHKYRMMTMLGLRTNAELMRHAVRLGITPL